MTRFHLAFVFFVCWLIHSSQGFTGNRLSSIGRRRRATTRVPDNNHSVVTTTTATTQPTTTTTTTTTTTLWINNNKADVSGGDRGLVIFTLVMLVNIWLFSIPPQFRRQDICTADFLEKFPQATCITFDTWKEQVADYYRNGGGVQFDFSIDPRTLAKNKAMLDQMMGGSSD